MLFRLKMIQEYVYGGFVTSALAKKDAIPKSTSTKGSKTNKKIKNYKNITNRRILLRKICYINLVWFNQLNFRVSKEPKNVAISLLKIQHHEFNCPHNKTKQKWKLNSIQTVL